MDQHEVAMNRSISYLNAAGEFPVGSNAFRNAVAAGSAWRAVAQELRIGKGKRTYYDVDATAAQAVLVSPQSLVDDEPDEESEDGNADQTAENYPPGVEEGNG